MVQHVGHELGVLAVAHSGGGQGKDGVHHEVWLVSRLISVTPRFSAGALTMLLNVIDIDSRIWIGFMLFV